MNRTNTQSHGGAAHQAAADPWSAMISRLKAGDAEFPSHDMDSVTESLREARAQSAGGGCRDGAIGCARTPASRARSTRVTFVERFSPKTVSITWRDATAANYTEQLWTRRIARSKGVCALTGSPIVRGDVVYSPAVRASLRPTNSTQMVLATVLEKRD